MVRLSLNETTTFRWSFEEDVRQLAAAGIPSIGVWRHKLSDYGQEKAVQLLAESGLAVSHLHWAGGFTGSDGRSFRAAVADAVEAIRTAALLQTRCLVVYSGARAGHTANHARRLFRDALAELAPVAASLQVDLAIEPMHPACAKDFTFLTRLEEAVELIDAVGSPAVKLLYDTYHLGQEDGCLDRISAIVPIVSLVQLGDSRVPPTAEQSRCLLGEGIVPLTEIVRAFLDAGYDGDMDVELFGEDVENIDYHQVLEHSKQAFSRLVG